MMLVFIDESGDPGCKIAKGSSVHFVMAMVIFDSEARAQSTQNAIKGLLENLAVKPEFKFNKFSHDIRSKFFIALQEHRFTAADMVAGAVARSYKPDREHHAKWRTGLERCGQLQNVWNFR
jgi:hypothetical protein